MSTRDLTLKFLKERAKYNFKPMSNIPKDSLLQKVNDDCNLELENISVKLTALKNLHVESLKVKFNHDTQKEAVDIKNLDLSIKKCVERYKENILKLYKDKNANTIIYFNARKILSEQISKYKQEYSNIQLSYINALKEKKEKTSKLKVTYDNDDFLNMLSDDQKRQFEDLQMQLERKLLTEKQKTQILENQKAILERDNELKNIHDSLVEVNEIFKALSDMIIEQNLHLNKIDDNITKAENNVNKGVKDLDDASRMQNPCLIM